MRTTTLAAVLAVAVGGLAYLDNEDEVQVEVQDQIARCLSQIERHYPVEDWSWARPGDAKVSIAYSTRVRGGLMRRKASCIGNSLVSW